MAALYLVIWVSEPPPPPGLNLTRIIGPCPNVFLSRVAINKTLPAGTQSFASSVYKIKHMDADRYYQYAKIVQALILKQKYRSKMSQIITAAQKGYCHEINC